MKSANILRRIAPVMLLAGCASLTTQDKPTGPSKVDRSVIPREMPSIADQQAYLDMLRSAREWQRKAASVDSEWRDVDSLLEQAAEAAGAGNYAQAIERAEQARFQAEMGYRQADVQQEVTHPPFLYY